MNKIGLQKLSTKKEEGVLPGSSCYKHRADIVKVEGPLNPNFNHPAQETEGKNPQISTKCVMNRNQRSKLLHQQKERFINKYKEKGNIFQQRNFSYENIDPFWNDIIPSKDDSLHLDPLVNPRQVNFNKTKAAEERYSAGLIPNSSNKFIPSVESWNEKRKGLGTVKQAKRKTLKLKDKTDTLVRTGLCDLFIDPKV